MVLESSLSGVSYSVILDSKKIPNKEKSSLRVVKALGNGKLCWQLLPTPTPPMTNDGGNKDHGSDNEDTITISIKSLNSLSLLMNSKRTITQLDVIKKYFPLGIGSGRF